MIKYGIKRVLMAIPMFFVITVIVFILSNLAPGSALDTLAAAGDLSDEAYEALKVSLGLDQPVIVRYGIWVWDLLHGDMGSSIISQTPVSYLISQRIGATLLLCGASILLAVVISIPLGVMAAYKPYSVWDNLSSALAFVGVSLPSFFACMMLIYFFAVKLRWLPAQGMHSVAQTGLGDLLKHMILPTIALALLNVGNFIKQARGSVLEVLNEEYIKTARAKGLQEYAVVVNHALRNALIPVVTTIGMTIPGLVGGAIITEQMFSWSGMGSLMIYSIQTRDFTTTMGCVTIISLTVLATNIVLDFVYAWLDPRIRGEA